jgi:hypothetical protein
LVVVADSSDALASRVNDIGSNTQASAWVVASQALSGAPAAHSRSGDFDDATSTAGSGTREVHVSSGVPRCPARAIIRRALGARKVGIKTAPPIYGLRTCDFGAVFRHHIAEFTVELVRTSKTRFAELVSMTAGDYPRGASGWARGIGCLVWDLFRTNQLTTAQLKTVVNAVI